MCRPFIYSGCQGNANNFVNLNDCVQACVRIPSQPVALPAEVDLFKARTILISGPRFLSRFCVNPDKIDPRGLPQSTLTRDKEEGAFQMST